VPDLTVLALDLGGSHAACALVHAGSIVAQRNLRADGACGLRSLLPALGDSLDELLQSTHTAKSSCAAAVMGFCGVVSAREKRVLATNGKFDDATGLDLKTWFEHRLEIPFFLENDTRLALLGEHRFGAARDFRDAAMVTLGSGIGGAALLDGRLLESKHGLAGTIGGHLPVVMNGRICSCGNRGCAEAEASTSTLGEIYREQAGGVGGLLDGRKTFGFADIFEAIEAGDQAAAATLEHCLRVWSVLTVSLIHAYDPEVVVFGGSVMKRSADILPCLQKYVNAHAWTSGRSVPLRAALLGSDATLLGALALVESAL